MLLELIDAYESFHDALILDIHYSSVSRLLELTIRCMNKHNDYEWEIIKLSLIGVQRFRFVESERTNNVFINSALIKADPEKVVIDFFPFIYSNDKLIENPDSDFLIHCKSLMYEQLHNSRDINFT